MTKAIKINYKKSIILEQWLLWGIKVFLLLILFVFLNHLIDKSPLPFSMGTSSLKRFLIGSLQILTIFGFLVALLSRSIWICWCALVWVIMMSGLQVAYLSATGSVFGPEEAYLLLSSAESVLSCVNLYWKQSLPGVIALIIVLLVMATLIRRFVISFSPWWSLVSVAVMGVSLVVTWSSNCDGYNAVLLSAPYRITSILTYVKATRYVGERRQPLFQFDGVPSRRFPHIVLIVDESVLGCELSINGYPRPTVPFLDKHRNSYWNGGIASSGANNTYESHRILLSGLRQEQLPDIEQLSEKNASVFQYAIQAGYPSMCLSAQEIRNTLTGGLPSYSSGIFLYVEKINPAHDFDLINILRQRISDQDMSFTYVVKKGNHFPYAERYPKNQEIFHPSAPPEFINDIAMNVNAYDNALRWNCDEFISRLTQALESTRKNIIVIYTSDHGQVMLGQPDVQGVVRMPHGHPHLPPIVANVPLLAFGFGKEGKDFLQRLRSNSTLSNNCSHFRIFPTLLLEMGYSPENVRKYYGKSLRDRLEPDCPRYFIAGRLGRARSMVKPFPLEQNKISRKLYSNLMNREHVGMFPTK